MTEQERFWSQVDKSGRCWLWQAGRDGRGYGVFKRKAAHRYAYRISKGEIPHGLYVCHSCDNPPCVNPAHLWLGTPADNTHDALDKGRLVQGEQTITAKLTLAQVLEIRKRYADGDGTLRTLGEEYGVSHTNIRLIVNDKSWRLV